MTLSPTRSTFLLACLALSLSGCGLFGQGDKKSPLGTPERACEDAADADPKLHDFWATTPATADPATFPKAYQEERQRLITECLRIRSGRPKGGVERVKPSGWL